MQVAKPKKGYKLVRTRFSMFEIPEAWNIRRLNEICKDPISGSRPKGGVRRIKDGIPSLGGEHINEDSTFNYENIKFVPKSFFENAGVSKVNTNDVVVVKDGATTGRVAIVDEEFPYKKSMINEHIFILRNKNGFAPKWLFYYLFSKLGQEQIKIFFQGSAQGGINTSFVRGIEIITPTSPEQQQIATILSDVDSALQKTNQIIEQTQRLKNGMVQKLLTRGIGHTKFKKIKWYFGKYIEIPEEWELRKLGDVCELLDSERIPLKESDRAKMNGNIPYYGASGVIDYVNDYIFDEKLLCLGEDGENLRSRVKPLAFTIQGKSWVNNHAHVLRPNNLTIHEYLECYLNQISVIQHLDFSAQPKLNQTEMKKIKFTCPSISEQKQIASILSNVDTQIQKEKLHKSNLDRLKKGLMQKLLTGQIRVKVR